MLNDQYLLLIVDDIEENRDLLVRRLGKIGYETHTACDGQEALDMLDNKEFEYDLVLLDVMMPKLNGFQVLEDLKERSLLNELSVIMISAMDEVQNAITCIELGAVDYLAKPVNQTLLKTKVRSFLEKARLLRQEKELNKKIAEYNDHLEEKVQHQIKEISSTQLSAIFALSKLAESRDPETGEHLERVGEYCRVLSKQLRKSPKYKEVINDEFIENIYTASAMHDIGKVGIPDRILLKPDKLTDAEWVIMRKHPGYGAETLREVDRTHPGNAFIRIGIDIAAAHHEKWDGSGYPNNLKGDQIPLVARIMALGDVYDALTSKRCYKEAFSHAKSSAIIYSDKSKHFDPDVVDAFEVTEEQFRQIRLDHADPEHSKLP